MLPPVLITKSTGASSCIQTCWFASLHLSDLVAGFLAAPFQPVPDSLDYIPTSTVVRRNIQRRPVFPAVSASDLRIRSCKRE